MYKNPSLEFRPLKPRLQPKHLNMSEVIETARQLRSQNAQALVSKLSDTLLSSIFLVLTPPWSSTGYYFGPTFQLARAISQVCFRWRQLSLGLPSLWRSIELRFGTLEWKEELFRRSANAPFIEIHSIDDETVDEVLDVPGIIPRIRYFQGGLSVKGWVQLFNGAQTPGSLLEYLELNDKAKAPDEPTKLTFHGHPPPLQKLWVTHTDNFDLSSPFFSNLLDLTIHQKSISVSQLASILQNMPLLELLNINVGSFDVDDVHLPSIPISQLRRLFFTNVNLLQCVDIHRECMLRTWCEWSNHKEFMSSLLPRFIFDHTQNKNPYLGFEISEGELVIRNRKSFDWGQGFDECDSLFVSIAAGRPSAQQVVQRWPSLLEDLTSGLASILPTITVLIYENRAQMGWENLDSFFCHFTGVHTVSFGNINTSEVFPSLKRSYDDGSGSKILFPSLHTLHLPHNYEWQGDVAEFKSYLAWRIEQGAPIKYLVGSDDNDREEWSRFGREVESAYGVKVNIAHKRTPDPLLIDPYQVIGSYLADAA